MEAAPKRIHKTHTCSQCGGTGHNKATCRKLPPATVMLPPLAVEPAPPAPPVHIPFSKTLGRLERILLEVARVLGRGRSEAVVAAAICVELGRSGLNYVKEEPVAIDYKGVTVGMERLDIRVFAGPDEGDTDTVIELKAVAGPLTDANVLQLCNYLTQTNTDVGILVNFPTSMSGKLEVRSFISYGNGNFSEVLNSGLREFEVPPL